MSTILNSLSRTASRRNRQPATVAPSNPSRMGLRGLTAMLLAAAVSALVLLADEVVGVWSDEHLLFGWVAMWAVVFAVLALFAGTARNLAASALGGLDTWSQSIAHARAEARMWEIAKSDPRIMAELQVARTRDEATQSGHEFDDALAPMGFDSVATEIQASGQMGFCERLAESRTKSHHHYYI